MYKRVLTVTALFLCLNISAKEYHVAKNGNNANSGTKEAPFLTIQKAANTAQPGDVITVHQGTYREWVKPATGGISDTARIVYQAASGEQVEIKGSEIVTGWENIARSVWRVKIPNSFFGDFNPYQDLIDGDWFDSRGRVHHTGEVYLNGKSLWEMALLEDVFNPKERHDRFDPKGSTYTWFCESNKENTFIYANFQGEDPNKALIEINVRRSCFYPAKTGVNYITIRGFKLAHAATNWAPPTAEQVGLIGTNWSKGWIIENNFISDSRCSGITLGKHGDEFDNKSQDFAEGYVETIKRGLKNGWNKENIGSHIVRNNTITNCEQTGICGSLGAIFSVVEKNNIYNISVKHLFGGAEIAGIKFHAAIDVLIKNNRLSRCGRGLWLDWMAQGTQVTGNLFYNNDWDDLFVEVNHGPFVVENNLLLSKLSLQDWSEGGAYVHNLFAGNLSLSPQGRLTPYHPAHSTDIAGLKKTKGGDDRFYNNIFVGGVKQKDNRWSGLKSYINTEIFPVVANGNVYMNGANLFSEENSFLASSLNPEIRIVETVDSCYLEITNDNKTKEVATQLVTTKRLGKALVPDVPFLTFDGKPLGIDKDYFGNNRNLTNPTPGPFEAIRKNKVDLKVW
ncbi:DUF1565 domain-containing protein [Planctomycetota bacterium]